MLDALCNHIETFATYAPVWGFLLIFFFMMVESSFIPFPSEVVMIPAGFMAYRGELSFASFVPDFTLAVIFGLAGSLAGAYINYYLSLYLGRPILYRYGKYFFLSEKSLNRAEELFVAYGDIATFVCRLLPGIRQLISIPAGLSKMKLSRFTFFTGLGAGIWVVILTGVGAYLGKVAGDASYTELVHKGKDMITDNYIQIIIGLVVVIVIYAFVHHKVMTSKKADVPPAA